MGKVTAKDILKTCPKCNGKGSIQATWLLVQREKAGLTQEELSTALGMRRTAYTMVELGKTELRAKFITPLSEAINVPVQDILLNLFGDKND